MFFFGFILFFYTNLADKHNHLWIDEFRQQQSLSKAAC